MNKEELDQDKLVCSNSELDKLIDDAILEVAETYSEDSDIESMIKEIVYSVVSQVM